MKYKKLAKDIV